MREYIRLAHLGDDWTVTDPQAIALAEQVAKSCGWTRFDWVSAGSDGAWICCAD